jgi:cation transport ATPase
MYAARSKDSTLQGIIRVVEQASQSRASTVRLADRYAVWFIPLPLALLYWHGP